MSRQYDLGVMEERLRILEIIRDKMDEIGEEISFPPDSLTLSIFYAGLVLSSIAEKVEGKS
jgi:hypothetical protein